jgi:hypothetical protein
MAEQQPAGSLKVRPGSIWSTPMKKLNLADLKKVSGGTKPVDCKPAPAPNCPPSKGADCS